MEDRQITIPPELENILLEFTINAIVENPADLVGHAADYFTNLRNQRTQEVENVEGSREDIARTLSHRHTRRGTVMGESFNPEEEDEEDEIEITPKTDEERIRIKSQSADIFLFRVLDGEDFNAVIDAMIRTPVEKDQIIITQGEDGDYFYLIDRGSFDVLIKDQSGNDKHVATYEDKGFFGELALLHNQPRAATIKAATEGLLWAVDRKTFNRLIVKRAFQKRQMYMELLEGVEQLKPLTDYEKMQVADALAAKSYSEGDIIVNEGDEGDGMYFIVEGKVSVRQKKQFADGNVDEEIAQLERGSFFGELALVKHQPRAATVVAMEDTKAAFLEVKAFERLLGPCLEIMEGHAKTYDK